METLKPHRESGYSLIEVMVASLILGMTIAAVVSMLRIGRDLQRNGDYRRQALLITESALEDPQYHFYRYPVLAPGTDPVTNTTPLTLNQSGAIPLPCTLRVTMSPVQTNIALANHSPPYKRVQASLSWNDNGLGGTVTLQKLITELR